jgi:hypothetical protein
VLWGPWQNNAGILTLASCPLPRRMPPRWGNTTPLQIELDRKLVWDLGGVASVEALIMAHNAQGGTLINTNVTQNLSFRRDNSASWERGALCA